MKCLFIAVLYSSVKCYLCNHDSTMINQLHVRCCCLFLSQYLILLLSLLLLLQYTSMVCMYEGVFFSLSLSLASLHSPSLHLSLSHSFVMFYIEHNELKSSSRCIVITAWQSNNLLAFMHVKRQSMGIFVHGICTLIHSLRICNKSMFQWIPNLDEILFEFCIVFAVVAHCACVCCYSLRTVSSSPQFQWNILAASVLLRRKYTLRAYCVGVFLFLPHRFPITINVDASFVTLFFCCRIQVGVMIALIMFTIFAMQYFSLYLE